MLAAAVGETIVAEHRVEFVTRPAELLENALTLADAIRDGTIEAEEAASLVAAGKVFLPFRYGQGLAFAPAKFIGYRDASISAYRATAKSRSGSRARVAITRLIGDDASYDDALEARLENYCLQIGVRLESNRHSFWRPVNGLDPRDRSAIDDVDATGFGNDDPEYRRRMAGTYVRDQKVRDAVLERADGRCEYCGIEGFETRNGRHYLEAHHVISLAKQGADRLSNVIALCATDHRRAHFGADWESLQDEFTEIIGSRTDD